MITSAETLAEWVRDTRERTVALVSDLTAEKLIGPRLDIVNPLLWEIGHVAWFYEKWVLRHSLGQPSVRSDSDALYDSVAIPHETRWDLPLPSREETFAYMTAVQNRVLNALSQFDAGESVDDTLAYHVQYSVFHEDMHTEAFTYTRQTLEYPAPDFDTIGPPLADGSASRARPEDIVIPGGEFQLGAADDGLFAFDNEKQAHPVRIEPFAISRTPVQQSEFAEFVRDGGYERRELWSAAGWQWREDAEAEAPVYWNCTGRE